MNFSEILSFLTEGRKYSFVVAVGGGLVTLLAYHEVWPVTLLPDLIVAMLFVAAAMGSAALVFELGEAGYGKACTALHRRRKEHERDEFLRAAPDRLSNLTRREAVNLFWLLVNDRAQVEGAPTELAFSRLVDFGILVPTADGYSHQVLRVNPHVWDARKGILEDIPRKLRLALRDATPPWNQRI